MLCEARLPLAAGTTGDDVRAVLEARARGKEMHLTSKWAQIRRNIRLAFQHQVGGDKTGLKLAEFYDYDVASASRLPDTMLGA